MEELNQIIKFYNGSIIENNNFLYDDVKDYIENKEGVTGSVLIQVSDWNETHLNGCYSVVYNELDKKVGNHMVGAWYLTWEDLIEYLQNKIDEEGKVYQW